MADGDMKECDQLRERLVKVGKLIDEPKWGGTVLDDPSEPFDVLHVLAKRLEYRVAELERDAGSAKREAWSVEPEIAAVVMAATEHRRWAHGTKSVLVASNSLAEALDALTPAQRKACGLKEES